MMCKEDVLSYILKSETVCVNDSMSLWDSEGVTIDILDLVCSKIWKHAFAILQNRANHGATDYSQVSWNAYWGTLKNGWHILNHSDIYINRCDGGSNDKL